MSGNWQGFWSSFRYRKLDIFCKTIARKIQVCLPEDNAWKLHESALVSGKLIDLG